MERRRFTLLATVVVPALIRCGFLWTMEEEKDGRAALHVACNRDKTALICCGSLYI